MCGRYSITIDKSTIEYHFNAKFVTGAQEFEPTYNAAPSQLLPIITTDKGPSAIVLAKWGFVPEHGLPRTVRPQNNAVRARRRKAHVQVRLPKPPLPRDHRRLQRVAH